jgi:mono/diheme cytochrome c family protein
MTNRSSPAVHPSARKKTQTTRLLIGVLAILLCAAADGSWLKHVPEADRQRVNPYAGQADAVAAGGRLFADHCAQCHGPDALGRGKRPSLRSDRVQNATDGEIFWLLKNGNLSRGMPTWAALPEQSRWQIIAYVKSLGKADSEQESPETESK